MPITKTKVIPALIFAGRPQGQRNLKHDFADNGLVIVTNDEGDQLSFQIPAVTGLTSVGDVVSYVLSANVGGARIKGTVAFDFATKPNGVKITISGTSSKATTLVIPFNGNRAWKYQSLLKQIWTGVLDVRVPGHLLSGVGFDWSEVQGITHSFNETNKQLTFNVGTSFSIDPSTVDTSTSSWAKGTPDQRQTFYAAGRHWVFYNDGTNLVYSSSVDGATSWSADVSCGAVVMYLYSVYWDGTYVHYALQRGATPYSTYYRRGTPVSDGTITWSAAEQTVQTGTTTDSWYTCQVYCDSNGKAWISFLWKDVITPAYYPKVCRNANTNGTWANDTGYPLALSATSSGEWEILMAVLTNGRMYAFYSIHGAVLRGKLYDGTNWGAEENTFSAYNSQIAWATSISSFGDDVIVAYIRDTTYQLRSIYRLYGTGWGTDTLVQDSVASLICPMLSVTATGEAYMFWAGKPTANHIYYKKRTAGSAGTWDANATDWLTETAITQNYNFVSSYRADSTYIGVSWMTSANSPYNVRYDFLTIAAAGLSIPVAMHHYKMMRS